MHECLLCKRNMKVSNDVFGNEQRYDQSIKGAIISNGIVHDDVLKFIKNNIIEN